MLTHVLQVHKCSAALCWYSYPACWSVGCLAVCTECSARGKYWVTPRHARSQGQKTQFIYSFLQISTQVLLIVSVVYGSVYKPGMYTLLSLCFMYIIVGVPNVSDSLFNICATLFLVIAREHRTQTSQCLPSLSYIFVRQCDASVNCTHPPHHYNHYHHPSRHPVIL